MAKKEERKRKETLNASTPLAHRSQNTTQQNTTRGTGARIHPPMLLLQRTKGKRKEEKARKNKPNNKSSGGGSSSPENFLHTALSGENREALLR